MKMYSSLIYYTYIIDIYYTIGAIIATRVLLLVYQMCVCVYIHIFYTYGIQDGSMFASRSDSLLRGVLEN